MKSLTLLLLLICATTAGAQTTWHPANGPEGAYVTQIIVDRDGDLFAGTARGIYHSSDDGASWSAIERFAATPEFVQAMALDSNGRIYAYTAYQNFVQGTLHISSDKGRSWDTLVSPPSFVGVSALAASGNGTLFFSSRFKGLFRSVDAGSTWERMAPLRDTTLINTIGIDPHGVVYAAVRKEGVYRSTDNGDTWSFDSLSTDNVMAFAFSNGHLFAGTMRDNIYRRDTNGWRKISTDSLRPYIRDFAVDQAGSLYAASYEDGVFKSTDDGVTWSRIDLSIPGESHDAIEIGRDGRVILGSYGLGIQTSTDRGASWLTSNRGMRDTRVYSLLTLPDGSLVAGSSVGILRTTDRGASWSSRGTGLESSVPWHGIGADLWGRAPGGRIFAATIDTYFASDDNGATWLPLGSPVRPWALATALAPAPDGSIYASSYDSVGFYRSTDGGSSWEPREIAWKNDYAWSILFDSSGGVIVGGSGQVWLSNDEGMTWRRSVIPRGGITRDLVITPRGTIVHIQGGITLGRRSADSILWTEVPDTDVSNAELTAIAVSPDGTIAVGEDHGRVYVSRDDGATWNLYAPAYRDRTIESLAFGPDGRLYAGTTGDGLWVSDPVAGSSEGTLRPALAALSLRARPNPVSSGTRISFVLPAPGDVTIAIHSISGEEIARLSMPNAVAGENSVDWDASALAAGSYLCTVTTATGVSAPLVLQVR